MSDQPLHNRLIAVPEARELDLFTALLERRGARVLRVPLVAILDAPDPEPVLGWLQQFCEGAPDRLFGIGQTAVRSVPEAILVRAAWVCSSMGAIPI